MNKAFLFFSCVLTSVFFDQVIKFYVRENMPTGIEYPFIKNFISFLHIKNTGVSFGFLGNLPKEWAGTGMLILILVTSAVLLAVVFFVLSRIQEIGRWTITGFGLIVGGGIGNNIDRIVFGEVTDYMYFKFYDHGFFINNLADDVISIGFVILLFFTFRENSKKGK